MARARIITAAAAVACFALASVASAQLDDHVWVGGTGSQLWQVDANWNLEGMATSFPNDPGRVDSDPAVITNVVGANLSVNLAANLLVDVGATDVTVAALTLGGTGGPVTTNITSGGGRLVFENFELNNSTDPNNLICAFNCGTALVTSQGVAGSTNTISAVVGINDSVDVAGTNNITLAGGIAEIGTGASIRAVPANMTVFVTGDIVTLNQLPDGGTFDAQLGLNSTNMNQGTLDISGAITGNGRLRIGTPDTNSLLPMGTVILRNANTYDSRTFVGRGNIVMANNNAFGAATGVVRTEGPALQTGYNFRSDDDTRTIPNDVELAEWATAKGEHSMTWTGKFWQTNTRGWINMLPAGKTLTLTGELFPKRLSESPTTLERNLTFDGSGTTKLMGALRNVWDDDLNVADSDASIIGSYRFRGTGTVFISGGMSTYVGSTIVEGANVHYATNADLGNTAGIVSEGGAIGLDSGVIGNATFLGKLNSSSNPAPDLASNLVVFDRGGLMLAANEYGMNLDFTSGDLANAANMSLAAHETGNTYTGTITPAANTYRFGGGSGTLILPNLNQLTGTGNVVATNGGEVRITGSNNYTGTTSIIAKYQSSLQEAGERDTNNYNDGDNIPNDQRYVGTTLSVSTLANGGAASNIGSSTSNAGNLYIQGSTLKYTGSAASTDRLFTIGSSGATIDASGSGALNFTNTAALGVDIAEERTGNVNAFATSNGAENLTTVRNLPSTEDLRPGMPIMSPGQPTGIQAGAVITRIASATDVLISVPVGESAFFNNTPITFGPAPERKLTLTGTNTGNNTLASVVPNASDGGVVGLTKTGTGKWALTGNNSYTGTTTVSAGTLLVNGTHSGAGAVTVAAAGTLGGTGSLAGAVTNNGTINAGTSVGTLTLNGGAIMGADSHWVVELLGTTADKLAITGNLDLSALGNALDVIDLGKTGTSWVIATYTGLLTGTLETITNGYTVDYGTLSNSQVTLNFGTVVGVPGDYNGNGTVDTADYVMWRNGGPLMNDPTPGVQAADYDFWRSRFGATSGSGSGAAIGTAAVPEPATALLAFIVSVGMIGLANRQRRFAKSN